MGRRFEIGPWVLDAESNTLGRNDQIIRLEPKVMEVGVCLAERAGQVVRKHELIRVVWPDTFVSDDVLTHAISELRKAFEDDPRNPRFIETIPKRGYRLIAEVGNRSRIPASDTRSERDGKIANARSANRTRVWIGSSVSILLIVSIGAIWFWRRSNTPKLTDRDTVVLADFTNTTGDAIFDDTLSQALAASLSQSPFLNVLSDERVKETLEMMNRRQPGEHISPDMAREICQRTGSVAVLGGSIARLESQYVIGLSATNCANGDSLAREQVQASRKEDVLNALGKAATSLRTRLGESAASIQRFDTPLAQATTSSLEALKAYTLAGRTGGATRYEGLLQHAIELDPNFAVAYCGLSGYYDGAGEGERAAEYAQKAFDHRQNATERERFFIDETYYGETLGDIDRELAVYETWEQMYPRDWGAWNDAASELQVLGDYTGALTKGQEALRLNPDQSNSYLNVGGPLLVLNRWDEVKQLAIQARAHHMDIHDVHILLYQVAFLKNDTKEMEVQLAPYIDRPDDSAFDALTAKSRTEAYFGRLRSSLMLLKRGLEIMRRANLKEPMAQIQDAEALNEAEFGNLAVARRTAAAALTTSTGRRAKILTALALARAGDVEDAQALADELNKQFPVHTMLHRYWLPTIRASIELARSNPSKALDALEHVSYELGDADGGTMSGNMYPVYVRGQAYLGTHQGLEAAVEFQKILEHRSIILNSPLAALAHLGLARAYSLQGNRVKARGAYQEFLFLWKDADPDVSVLKQAKAEYARLQ